MQIQTWLVMAPCGASLPIAHIFLKESRVTMFGMMEVGDGFRSLKRKQKLGEQIK